mmetsp:Transcript_7245/g.13196  ORF Transcript_7245/g.13196 Transcript_7245/m.13196 type:complete len:251 (-) Transcript_7245:135-887(-)
MAVTSASTLSLEGVHGWRAQSATFWEKDLRSDFSTVEQTASRWDRKRDMFSNSSGAEGGEVAGSCSQSALSAGVVGEEANASSPAPSADWDLVGVAGENAASRSASAGAASSVEVGVGAAASPLPFSVASVNGAGAGVVPCKKDEFINDSSAAAAALPSSSSVEAPFSIGASVASDSEDTGWNFFDDLELLNLDSLLLNNFLVMPRRLFLPPLPVEEEPTESVPVVAVAAEPAAVSSSLLSSWYAVPSLG